MRIILKIVKQVAKISLLTVASVFMFLGFFSVWMMCIRALGFHEAFL